jgi:hypothetical protein
VRSQHPLNDDEIILKRISPRKDNIKPKGGSGFRATSWAIQPRPGEEHSSWSQQSITPAKQLLEIEAAKGQNMSDWSVDSLTIGAVRALELDVVQAPTQEDPGHCLIVPTGEQPFTPKIWSKLAKKTSIIYTAPEAL